MNEPYVGWALDLAGAAAAVSNYCDHVDHNESASGDWISNAGHKMRELACEIAGHENLDLLALYAARLEEIEARNPLNHPGSFNGSSRAAEATTWRALQLVQAEHDRNYHPDVIGLSKFNQLVHYAFHAAKLSGALADVARCNADTRDFCNRRLPDLLLFGIKLATVTGKALPKKPLALASQRSHRRQLIAA
jgi:hypothetical protein